MISFTDKSRYQNKRKKETKTDVSKLDAESSGMLESEGEKGEEGEDHMEDRFEGISFPRIITTSSISPYNEGVTRGKSVTSPWRPGYCPRWAAINLPSARISEMALVYHRH